VIAKDSGTGKSFGGLVRYLEHGKRGEKADRVAWFQSNNLFAQSMDEAAAIMKDVANQNTRVEKPVYHFSINWHPEESDRVDQALALDITRAALKDIGLEDHQSLIVAHKDEDHFHVHIVANRIDPETGNAWVGSFSKMKLEQSMARLSLEHGFEVVPGYHNALDLGIDPPEPENAQTMEAIRFEERTETPAFDTMARVELASVFAEAEDWRSLQETLAERGFFLEPRGRGLVVGDGEGHFSKVSSIGREFSRSRLETRFGEPFVPREREEIEKPAGSEAERSLGRNQEQQETAGKGDSKPLQALTADLREADTWQAFHDVLEANELQCKRKGRGLVVGDRDGELKASSLHRSLSLGNLERRLGESLDDYYAKNPEANAGRRRHAAQRLERAVSELETFDRMENFAAELAMERQAVLFRTQESFESVRRVSALKGEMTTAAEKAFRNPKSAMAKFQSMREKSGTRAAVDQLINAPEKFGRLAGRGALGMGNEERRQAQAAMTELKRYGRDYVDAVSAVAGKRQQVNADMSDRFDEKAIDVYKAAREKVGLRDRVRLEKAVLDAAEGVRKAEIKDLPFRSSLRGMVVSEKVKDLRRDQETRKRTRLQDEKAPTRIKRWPTMPTSLLPAKAEAFDAVDRYAKAKHDLREASLKGQGVKPVARELIETVTKSAEAVVGHGKRAERYFSRFGVDRRVLQADARGPVVGAKEMQRASSFLNAKSPKIRIRFTTVLRLLGVPVPRIPKPRVPKIKSKSRGMSLFRELTR